MKRGNKWEASVQRQRLSKAHKIKNRRLLMRLGFPVESFWFLEDTTPKKRGSSHDAES